jgi:D-alanyl-D-alanine carboxypeptidase
LQYSRLPAFVHRLIIALAAAATVGLAAAQANAEALLLVEVESGKVLHAENATVPWYPASITKIMTTYVTLRAVKEGRITLDKLLTVSHNAVAQQPVKMGFPAGTTVTVDNALKMLLVKSANDMAVVLAEGVGGSIEGFADLMNQNAARLGMTQSSFVNPNGLPADQQIVSARDLAILVRAVLREFPEYDYYWHLPGIRLGKKVVRNYNTLLGRYPGTDGMKTGFICASGFNLVATATRGGKRLVAIVLGASSGAARAVKAAQLLEEGFNANPLSWLTPSFGTVDQLVPINTSPPNLRDEMCGGHRKRPASEDEDDETIANLPADSPYAVFLSSLRAPAKTGNLLRDSNLGEPVVVFTGPPRKPGEVASTTEAKAKPKAKPGAARPAVANAAAAVPWTSLSPSTLANHPPAEFNATKDGTGAASKSAAKSKAKAKVKADPKKQQNSQGQKKKAAPKTTAKPDDKQKTSQAAPQKK